MGMMERMRSLAPWFIITVGGLFILFMVLADSNLSQLFVDNPNIVGSINGTEITAKEFNTAVDRARESQSAQTGKDIDENQMDAFKERVWEDILTQKILDTKIEEFGITVKDEEVKDIIFGDNPPQFLKQNFIDSLGNFDAENYRKALLNPENKEILVQVQEFLKSQKTQEKLQSMLSASVIVTESEVKRRFNEQNTKVTAQIIAIENSSFPDKDFNVTEKEMKNYYEKNKEEYKVDEQRKVNYVVFPTTPSKEDTTSVFNNLQALIARIKLDTTTSFREFVETYSENPYAQDTLEFNSFPGVTGELLMNSPAGSIVGPTPTFEGFAILKVIGKVPAKDELVRASHILIPSGDNLDDAKALADSVYKMALAGNDFAQLAKEYSKDPGSASQGGELNWFGRGRMVPEFEEACFKGEVGKVQEPVKTSYGYHIIKVTGRNNTNIVAERISSKVRTSGVTFDETRKKAEDFKYLAEEDGFKLTAEQYKYNVIETPFFIGKAKAVPGIGVSGAIVKFAFDNSKGEISGVYKVPSGYVVAEVAEIKKAGYRDFSELEAQIKRETLNEMKLAKAKSVADKLRGKIKDSDSLGAVKRYEPLAKTTVAAEFQPTGFIPGGIGRDYIVTHRLLKENIGKYSDVIKGERGCYIVKVISRSEFNEAAYKVQRATIAKSIKQSKMNGFVEQWIEKIKENSEITDRRQATGN